VGNLNSGAGWFSIGNLPPIAWAVDPKLPHQIAVKQSASKLLRK
jgi:hypothetical protein